MSDSKQWLKLTEKRLMKYERKILFLVRHGNTRANIKGLYIGRKMDEPLVESEHLSWPESMQLPEQIFVSPMLRCRQTAQMITGQTEFMVINEFAEMDFGRFEGKGYEELKDDPYYQKWIDSNATIRFPEGESRNEFIRRSMNGFKKMCELIRKPEALLVAHGGTLMAIMSSLTGEEYFDFQMPTGTGFRCEIVFADGRCKCDSYEKISCREKQ